MLKLSHQKLRRMNAKAISHPNTAYEQLLSAWRGRLIPHLSGAPALKERLRLIRKRLSLEFGSSRQFEFWAALARLSSESVGYSNDFNSQLVREMARLDQDTVGDPLRSTLGPALRHRVVARRFDEAAPKKGAKLPRGNTHLGAPRTPAARRAEKAVAVLRGG